MKDRYLFRGKRLDNGEWVFGTLLRLTETRTAIIDEYPVNPSNGAFADKSFWCGRVNVFALEVDPNTVGQCTGLIDSKGELIFEGDILGSEKHMNMHGLHEIVYDDYTPAFMFSKVGSKSVTHTSEEACKHLFVYGNRWDNPELMRWEA